jgi:oligopeptide/dipeptide ABC transporter ATP-binding protein
MTTNNNPLLQAKNVKKHFQVNASFTEELLGSSKTVKAVDGVDLKVFENETVGLVGESGSGKTTLGRTLARLYRPTSGKIEFRGKNISTVSGNELKDLRKNIQYIFQDPRSALNPQKTVGQIISKPLIIHNLVDNNAVEDRVAKLLDDVGLTPSLIERYPHELSGGQRQRIGIARALAVEPDLIIADEPVTALDLSVQAEIINLMDTLQDDYGLSFVFIAHDLGVINHISERVLVMYLGNIVEKGYTDSVFDSPQHPYTRALLRSIPTIKGTKQRKATLRGEIPSPTNPPSGCTFHTRCPEYIDEKCSQIEPTLSPISSYYGAEEERPSEAKNIHKMACHWNDLDLEMRAKKDPYDK